MQYLCPQNCIVLACVYSTEDLNTTKIRLIMIMAVHTTLLCSGESNWFKSFFLPSFTALQIRPSVNNFACFSMFEW